MSDDPQYVLNRKAAADAKAADDEASAKLQMLKRCQGLAARGDDPRDHYTSDELAWCGYA
jgi:hypothetical protein